ncbi:MAG: hypothetical protein QG671_3839 [Actinomycetota bacterium]|mgnify:CR=1 FL=1|nr:hypothetical protein [Actinomycetota bacterium]HQZ84573.1 hypothetical protein [Actinomycetota bacterium]
MRIKTVSLSLSLVAVAALATGCSGSASSAASSAVAAASSAGAVASSAAAGAMASLSAATGGACEALNSVKADVEEQTGGAVTVGEAKAAAEKVNAQLDTVKQDAGPIKGALVTALQGAESAYLSQLAGTPDSTPVSQASPQLQAASDAVKSAYTSLTAALNC